MNTQILRGYAQQYLRREIDFEAFNEYHNRYGGGVDGEDIAFLSAIGLGCIHVLTKKCDEEQFRHRLIKLLVT